MPIISTLQKDWENAASWGSIVRPCLWKPQLAKIQKTSDCEVTGPDGYTYNATLVPEVQGPLRKIDRKVVWDRGGSGTMSPWNDGEVKL